MKNMWRNRANIAGIVSCIAISLLALDVRCEDYSSLLDRLASPDEAVRRQACDKLTLKGPDALQSIFERMNPIDKTPNLWAQNTARAIVHNAARPGAEDERARAEAALVHVLHSQAQPENISFAIRLVSRIGTEISAPALAKLLDDPQYREMALYALECNPSECVTPFLIDAYESANKNAWKAALIQTLGMRGDMEARKTVLDAIESTNADLRLAAIAAAGALPHRTTIKALWKVWNEGEGAERQAATDALLAAADWELDSGRSKSAAKIFHTLYEETDIPEWKAAGLAGYARANQRKALPIVTKTLQDADPILRGAAQQAFVDIPVGKKVKGAIQSALRSPQPEERTGAICVLALRHDFVTLSNLDAIIQTLFEAEGEAQEAAKFALTSIPGDTTTWAVIHAAKSALPKNQAKLVSILGAREDRNALPYILEAAKSTDADVSAAVIQALIHYPGPDSTAILKKALLSGNTERRKNALEAIIGEIGLGSGLSGDSSSVDLCICAAKMAEKPEHLETLSAYFETAGVTEAIAELAARRGLIVNWWVLGPIAGRARLAEEDVLKTPGMIDVNRTVETDGKNLAWNYYQVDNPGGKLDLLNRLASMDDVGCYLYSEVTSGSEREVLFKIGSDDDVFCWLNGKLVHKYLGARGWTVDQDVVQVTLQEGVNRICLKVLQYVLGWEVSLRITDLDGNPIALPQKSQ